MVIKNVVAVEDGGYFDGRVQIATMEINMAMSETLVMFETMSITTLSVDASLKKMTVKTRATMSNVAIPMYMQTQTHALHFATNRPVSRRGATALGVSVDFCHYVTQSAHGDT